MRTYVRIRLARDRVLRWLREVLGDESGATVAEYALVLVLVTVAVIGVLGQLGTTLQAKIQGIIDKLAP